MLALYAVRLRKNRVILTLVLFLPMLFLCMTGTLHPAASDRELFALRRNLEVLFPFFGTIPLSVLFHHREEPSLIVLHGTSLAKVALVDTSLHTIVLYVAGIVTGLPLLPAWIRPYFLLSYPVTLLFMIGLALFTRFLFGIRYGNIALYTLLFFLLYVRSGLSDRVITQSLCLSDPFVGAYAHGVFVGDEGMWYVLDRVLIQNRLFVLCISALLLLGSVLLSRQKRLYD